MDLRFIIPGTIRIKKNSRRIFGGGRKKINLPGEAYMEWQNKARFHFLKIGGLRFKPFADLCHVQVLVFYESHEPDLSGCLESVGDCFQKMIWKDDKQIVSWDGSRKYHDKDNPRTEITVTWDDGVEDKPMSQDECHRIAGLIGKGVKQDKEVKA